MAYPVQALVVDARSKHSDCKASALLFKLRPLLYQYVVRILSYEIHLVHEQEDFGLWAVLLQPFNTVTIIFEILDSFSCLDIKDINQHRDVLKYRRTLGGKIIVHEGILTTAVPKVENQVTKEADVILFHVDSCAEPRRQRCGIVRAGR